MPKIRIYLENKIFKDQNILLSKSHIHYLKNVMRRKKGDRVQVFNETSEWECICDSEKINILRPFRHLRYSNDTFDIWLCFSLVKRKNINNLVEKISEIGVSKIIPLSTEFSEKMDLNVSRLKRISIEAIEQSESMKLPKISEIKKIEEILKIWDDSRLIFFCDENGGEHILKAQPLLNNFKKVAIFIGPVGGWSDSERSLFSDKKIFRLSLGENILKADTAAIYSLSCVREIMR